MRSRIPLFGSWENGILSFGKAVEIRDRIRSEQIKRNRNENSLKVWTGKWHLDSTSLPDHHSRGGQIKRMLRETCIAQYDVPQLDEHFLKNEAIGSNSIALKRKAIAKYH